MSNSYEQISNLDSTVQDAGLYHGQVRCSEFSNNHGIEMPCWLTHGFPCASSLVVCENAVLCTRRESVFTDFKRPCNGSIIYI